MSAVQARALLALIVLSAASVISALAAAAGETGAPRTLRGARFEAAPATLESRRFRLRARLHAAPASAITGDRSPLRLSAVLAPKANAAACPLPEAIFSDGFESP